MSYARRVSTALRPLTTTAAPVFGVIALFWSTVPASAAQGDVVLYASDVKVMKGTWARVSSTTGAGGQLMTTPDAGLTVTVPLASPPNYLEASFSAVANTPYHVWLRLRAKSNSKSNSSVWVQFNDALNTSGSAVWRIGTTSGLLVDLEPCSGCTTAGWGWQDSAWWKADYAVVKFATTGTHMIRVQTREDGAQVDQIVLSPVTYFTAAPGAATNDATIVPKTTTSAVPPEIVLYAKNATRRSGNWAQQSDTTAAYGWRYGSSDYGAPKLKSPLGAPADFVEWTFNAAGRTRYRLWLRLKAAGNLTQNDSVWVQFSDSTNASGAATYRIGSTSALGVVLEACSGCGVSGWGWQNRTWWKSDTADVYFATTGTKTIRIQTREDGVRIDQIVLSPSRFLTTRPGTVKNDSTLVRLDASTTAISTALSSATTRSIPPTLTFTASTDHATLVLSYRVDVFKAGVNPSTTAPVVSLNLGKPAVVSGQITVNVGSSMQSLAPGSYFSTVSAIGSASSRRSAPSNTFSR
jgi:hypothetical protein